ncbi:MAG: CAP domain-containing protein, partial [Agathobacter sp.]|nr:CAP domain-containing protein [Agathobacter sp.]
MLTMINSFRTGPEAWQWNVTNTQKEQISGLQGLQYDYNLEKIAMQRAMELVVAYSHTRPNGESCFTAYTSGYGYKAENIAIGTGNMTAAYVFELWKESDKFYDGQGHRRNMLGRQYRAVGISHVYYNGCHYWVQEFGDAVVSSAPTTPNDQTTTVEVPVSSALNPTLTYRANPSSYKMIPGEICDLPTVTAELRTNETWYGAPSASVQSVGACDWTVQDKKYGFVTGTYQFAAMKVGQTNLVTTIGGQTITVPVTISNSNNNGGNNGNNSGGNSGGSGGDTGSNRVDLSTATIRLAQDSYVYDGYAKTPAVIVTLNGYTLKQDTDYTVKYSNNVSVGTAVVTVTGIGNYTGSASTTFTIIAQQTFDLSRAQITLSQNSYVYDGYAKTPAVTVTLNGYTLRPNIDYTVSYSN